MLEKPYFIMLHHQRGGGVTPLMDKDDNVAMFATVEEATDAASSQIMAQAFGWDLFAVGGGIDGGDGL